ncbi:MAG: hypothetical protein K2Q23_02380 [Bryobacteraceae bacterium]|nr:hypothetical protein [Bryobacteraceae bacterium]
MKKNGPLGHPALMTAQEKQLVRESFFELREVAGPLALLFYGRLFALEPELRRMFPQQMSAQGKKLMDMLAAAVDGLENWDRLKPALRDLGARHATYGVEARHYPLVVEAMLWSIGQSLAAGAGPEVKRAWSNLFHEIAAVMLDGAANRGE